MSSTQPVIRNWAKAGTSACSNRMLPAGTRCSMARSASASSVAAATACSQGVRRGARALAAAPLGPRHYGGRPVLPCDMHHAKLGHQSPYVLDPDQCDLARSCVAQSLHMARPREGAGCKERNAVNDITPVNLTTEPSAPIRSGPARQPAPGPDHGHLGLLHRLRRGRAVRAGGAQLPAVDGSCRRCWSACWSPHRSSPARCCASRSAPGWTRSAAGCRC